MAFVIEEELKKLPSSPGVYIMHDERDEIIYVGKAISLKNRVRQYFQSSRDKTEKIKKMVSKIVRFEYIVTDTELEALILENNLIKENRPKYNTLLKDDKTYPYIKVTVREDFPRILLTRQFKKDGAKYFGPFSSAAAVKDTIDFLQRAFQIRTCHRVLPRDIGVQRPCLNYHIHQCKAPCQGYIGAKQYQENISGALDFLNGNFEPVIEKLTKQMMEASELMDYEEALKYRDLIQSVRHVAQRQKITSEGVEDRDIIALAKDDRDAVIQVFFVREGRMVGREHHYIQVVMEESRSEILESFMKQFYAGTPFIPKEIWVESHLLDAKLIGEWLSAKRGSKVCLVFPKRGEKEKLMELARKNAELVLSKDADKLKREEKRSIGAVREIEKILGFSPISRMEAYDISNISGVSSVGSMVVYEDGKPKKSDYRKFRIQTVIGPNDYASMEEVLTRRFRDALALDEHFVKLPDLILMDGGRGQINIARGVLKKLDLDIPVCGMVKDDHHRTRGLYFNDIELPMDVHSEAFHLITRIQDEAHRFAIEYHRSLRGKTQVKSVLDEILGIGPVRRKALMRYFGEIKKIQEAEVEELLKVHEMDKKAAQAVYEFFHPKQ